MSLARLVQNFSQRRALLVTGDGRAVEALSTTLRKLGLQTEAIDGEGALVDLDPARDILFVDGDHAAPPSVPRGALGDLPAAPVVGLVGVEAPSRLKALMLVGATAFLSKPVYGGSVYSALYLAVNEHARKLEFARAAEELEARRRQRRHVIKAVVTLMRAHGLDDDAAFQVLRRDAMRARLSLETHCERLVGTPAGLHDDPAVRLTGTAGD